MSCPGVTITCLRVHFLCEKSGMLRDGKPVCYRPLTDEEEKRSLRLWILVALRITGKARCLSCLVSCIFILKQYVFSKGKVYQFLREKCARRSINKNRFQPKSVPHVTRKVYHPPSL